jgi:two-component system, NarL family, response regulator DegU
MSDLNRVVVACENTLLREGISKMLHEDEGIQIVAEASNLLELVQSCEEFQFDILLLDVELKGLNLSKILESVRNRNKNSGKVVLIIDDKFDEDDLINAILSGIRGYLSKDSNSNQLKRAVSFVHDGQLWVERKIMCKALEAFLSNHKRIRNKRNSSIYHLSKTELRILKVALKGQSNKQIAREVFLSEKTVKFHLYKIFRKLSVKSRSELILYGYRKGIVAT